MDRFKVSLKDAEIVLAMDPGQKTYLSNGMKCEASIPSLKDEPDEFWINVHIDGQHACFNYKYYG